MTTPQTLGLNIKQRRKAKGLTQQELADKLGVTRSYICDIERGMKNPSIQLVIDIADSLGVNIKKFF